MINPNSIIMEIRAGAGGEEAALFAKDLFLAYQRFAQRQEWQEKTLSLHLTDLGGYKKIIFFLKGENAWSMMKHEGGIHRVQRIPATEKGGRMHTSTISVVVLPEHKNKNSQISSSDIKIDFFRSSGPGGQNVNKRETAVRITHIPTGIIVSCQSERDQLKNRESALKILEAKIIQLREEQASQVTHESRQNQAAQAERAQKIRTYNFQRDYLKDHRLKKTWHNLAEIMSKGAFEPMIKQLRKNLS